MKHPISLEYILGLTAFTSGAVDIISYTRLGGILASAMTGNLAFLGLYIAKGEFYPALGSFIALLGYIAGTAIGQLQSRGQRRQVALTRLFGSEVLLLAVPAAIWFLAPHPPGSIASDAMIAAFALAMGTQSIVGKQVNLSGIPTVVFTSTLTNIVIGVTETFVKGEVVRLSADTKRQLASFFLYLFGAFCAGLLVHFRQEGLIAVPLAAAAAALLAHLAWGAEASRSVT